MSSIPNSAMPHAIAEPEPEAEIAPASKPETLKDKRPSVFSRAVRIATTPMFLTLGAGAMVYEHLSKRVGSTRRPGQA